MLDKIKRIPGVRYLYRLPFLLSAYHLTLAFLGALVYGFPSRRLTVIGVTGTKGKTTTCNLIAHILNAAGMPTGLATTVNFRIRDREWSNTTRQTMLGRFQLQKLLRAMVRAGCTHAVVETSSEGIRQYRHRFIRYHAALITNLYPEHLDQHGGLENYRAAKRKLFELIARRPGSVGIYNLADAHAEYFLAVPVATKYGYYLDTGNPAVGAAARDQMAEVLLADRLELGPAGTSLSVNGIVLTTRLVGEFNAANSLAAAAAARAHGLSWNVIGAALAAAEPVAGRMEELKLGQPFRVLIDYAYDPSGLAAALAATRIYQPRRTIVLTGIAAGHRDRWQRPAMGEVADRGADVIVVTTDDPYQEDPALIIDQVAAGALQNPRRKLGENIFKIVDRKEAIAKALALAEPGDLVLLAGKGGETAMKINGRKVGWDERAVATEALKAMGFRQPLA
ncbi:MAG: UDP-N-acetylmuramyl-tripeptide synthetase [Candidatus Liptonbacteria bacterium]|nr:UDP-N-acetylmuramyl-tripeptide synthetase [Candidatus Liptonbacteria bacterium]